MLKEPESLHVHVSKIEQITSSVKRFTLHAADGGDLPAFTGGSHILVHMSEAGQRHTNAYSLMNSPASASYYQIGVLLEPKSKGGSAFMHAHVKVGDTLEISTPKNLFGLAQDASHHVLIAGGIGITPILAQLDELYLRQAEYSLHYAFHNVERGAFVSDLMNSPHQSRTTFHVSAQGQGLDVDALIDSLQPQTHIYVCGPQRLINAVLKSAKRYNIPDECIHAEQFATQLGAQKPFTVFLAKSCKEVTVSPDQTILSALEKCGVSDVPFLCRSGVCGTCETTIIEGEAEHLDQYLTTEERESHKSLMVCVSRARSARLVLDL
jgi:ferredoxin-NADP reductase